LVDSPLIHDQSSAINALDDCLLRDWVGATRLSQRELKQYSQCDSVAGWRVTLVIQSYSVPIHLIVGTNYPYALPDIFLVGENKALTWPHVEGDNKLCVYPSNIAFNPADPVGVANALLKECKALLAELSNGTRDEDFADEFQSYWIQTVDAKLPRAVLTHEPSPPSRHIASWSGKAFTLLSENAHTGAQWLSNYHQDIHADDEFQPALFLWSDVPLMPAQYPHSNSDILKLAQSCGAEELLQALINEELSAFYIVVGFLTKTGPTFAAIRVQRPGKQTIPNGRGANPINKGFRPGHVPQHILTARTLSTGTKAHKLVTVRADESWIHSRGGNGKPTKNRSICMVGCGSLGAYVSHLLAQAGYDLVLIDPDDFDWENVGRHILGSPRSIRKNKAKALSEQLIQQLPHRNITFCSTKWESVWKNTPEIIMDCDIVVTTTGDWPSEYTLNKLNRTVPEFPDLVIGWTEAHALAGHALIVRDVGGCLCCGMSGLGIFSHEITTWEKEQMVPIPACGGFYQPYGAIDLSQIQSMVAHAVMDLAEGRIKTSEHRAWIGDTVRIKTLGGSLSPKWSDPGLAIEHGLREQHSPWAINPSCGLCRPNST